MSATLERGPCAASSSSAVAALACAALSRPGGGAAATRALARRHVRAGSSSRRTGRSRIHVAPRPAPGRADDARAGPLERDGRRRETLTAMQRRLAATAAAAGDQRRLLRPRDRPAERDPDARRRARRARRTAALERGRHARRARSTSAGWPSRHVDGGDGRQRRSRAQLPRRALGEGRALHGRVRVAARRPSRAASAAVLFPFPAATAEHGHRGARDSDARGSASVRDPARAAPCSSRAARRQSELAPEARRRSRRDREPDPAAATGRASSHAIGGGPALVRDGAPVFRANEAFTTAPARPARPADRRRPARRRRIVLVTVDGRQPGYCVGMTNFELAQTLVRLGAVTRDGARRRRVVDAGVRRGRC